MSTKQSKPLGSTQGLGTLVKARFGAGMLLQHDDLDALATYTQELSRLMFRSLFGCGVICGLVVTVEQPKCGKLLVRVAKGIALDSCGDPIAVNEAQKIEIDTQCDVPLPTTLWVVLCAKFKRCAPRTSMCASDGNDDAPSVSTRERYGYEIRVVSTRPECVCNCDPDDELHKFDCQCANPVASCYQAHYQGVCSGGCDCSGGGCSGECGCGCDCLVLACIDNLSKEDPDSWEVSHKVRRFIRPVLIEDPQARLEFEARQQAKEEVLAAAKMQVKAAAKSTPSKVTKPLKVSKAAKLS